MRMARKESLSLFAALFAATALPVFTQSTAPFDKLAARAEEARKSNRPDAAQAYIAALRANPSWKEGWWALGAIHYGADRYAECRDAYAKLAAVDPKSGPAWTMLGLCEFRTRQFAESLEHLRTGQRHGVDLSIDLTAKYHLLQLLARDKQFEAALNVAVELAHSGKEVPAWVVATGAAALWRPLLADEFPAEDRELFFLAGRAFWDAAVRNAVAAKASFTNLLAKYPETAGVHYLYGGYALLEAQGQAIQEFEKELQISPDHVGALTALAAEFLRQGDSAKALPPARRAAELFPDSFAARTLLGRVLAASGDPAAALKELEKSRELAPNEPQTRIALASVYASLGRKEDASRERREFVRLNSANKKPGEQ